ncbi:MAG: CidA/LrgA family protein [Ruminococcaceae bacterium]|nr:CidA/LrgA family protein [Oscillospiraceae bacterium]
MMANYLRQGAIIFGFTLLGEALNRLIPLPIPAAVYGLVFLFAALCLKIVKLEHVRELSNFLLTILPFLFVAPAVNLLESWNILAPQILPIVLLVVSSTILVFAIAGLVTQALCRKGDSDGSDT